jgi:hypothetical protein
LQLTFIIFKGSLGCGTSSIQLCFHERKNNILSKLFKMTIGMNPQQKMATSSRSITQSFQSHEQIDITQSSRRYGEEGQLSQLHRLVSILDAAMEIVSGEPSLAKENDTDGRHGSK